jgi:hypothetical protein
MRARVCVWSIRSKYLGLSELNPGLGRPWGSQEVEAPRLQDNRHMKMVSLTALRTGCLYSTRNIPGIHFSESIPDSQFIRVIKSRRTRRVRRVIGMVRIEMHREFWWGALKKGGILEYPGVDVKIIWKCAFNGGDNGSPSPRHGVPSGCGWSNGSQIWG